MEKEEQIKMRRLLAKKRHCYLNIQMWKRATYLETEEKSIKRSNEVLHEFESNHARASNELMDFLKNYTLDEYIAYL